MKRDEAKRLVTFQVQYDEERRVAVPRPMLSYDPPTVAPGRRGYIYVDEQETEAPRLIHSAEPKAADDVVVLTPLMLPQLERVVGELASAVERGDVTVDVGFRARVRVVADRLLSLIRRDDTTTIN